MMTLMILMIIGGGAIVMGSRSPYFGIFGVLLQSLGYSGICCLLGASFFGLLIVLVYIGGMMVVFLFSTILSAERHPSSSWLSSLINFLLLLTISPFLWTYSGTLNFPLTLVSLNSESVLGEVFGLFGLFTLLVGIILLWALIVVLLFGFEHSRNSLRKL
uniref:NADH-ubiquinone oxidoreductase chain 6 n=1 Tax=Amphiura sinicola TaxID=2705302 RepID=A0A6C0FCP2_9ECHI|nr:NADH dehydrogenase subunit 6 [Amphiura sinicola]QHT54217.1 NADH dehydrogenase subunit 6 [Amphiura sinicola]